MTRPDHPFVRIAQSYGALWVPSGPLDGWISWKGFWMPVRIIDTAARSDFTPSQDVFVADCRGCAAPFLTWRSEADVISSLGSRGRP